MTAIWSARLRFTGDWALHRHELRSTKERAERERHYLASGVHVYVELDLAGDLIYCNGESDLVKALRAGIS